MLLLALFLMAFDNADATRCVPKDAELIANEADTIFVAFITEGQFVEGAGANACGTIEGNFEVVQELKGDPSSVLRIRKTVRNCSESVIRGSSDTLPIGKYVLIATNSETARLTFCDPVWDSRPSNCLVDSIQRHLGIESDDPDLREWCLLDEQPGGRLSGIESGLQYMQMLERERDALIVELEEMNAELERLRESHSPR